MSAIHDRLTAAVTALAVIAVGLSVGLAVPSQPLVAVGVALIVLIIGATAANPLSIPLMAMPLLLVVERVPLDSFDLSASDFALFSATWPALLLGRRPLSKSTRNILWLTVVYQVSTLFTVIANWYTANAVEWVHAWFLTGGALIVGWSLGAAGKARLALWLIMGTGSLIAVMTIIQFAVNLVQGSLGPVYLSWPLSMHKNFIGTTLGIVAIVAYAAPPWVSTRRLPVTVIFWLCTAAVLMSQSRQAILALAIAVVLLVLRTRPDRRRSKLVLWAVIPALYVVVSMVRGQLASDNQFNSSSQRLTWFSDSLDIWRSSPIFGAGLRWWYTDRVGFYFQPPNAELEMLTSAGLIGLAGFLALMVGTVVILWRVGPTYGGMGALAVLSRILQGQMDLFWTAVQVSLAFVVAGLCLGALARVTEKAHPIEVPSDKVLT